MRRYPGLCMQYFHGPSILKSCMHKRRPGYHRIIFSYVLSSGAATRPVSLSVFTPRSFSRKKHGRRNEPLHSYSLIGRPLSSSDQAVARAKGADTRARLIRGAERVRQKPRVQSFPIMPTFQPLHSESRLHISRQQS